MATLNIKNVPDPLYKKLRVRAKRERRSVAQEVIQILTQATQEPEPLSILALKGLGKNSGAASTRRHLWSRSGARGIDGRGLHLPLLRTAAQLRARVRVRTPDAVQLAAALAANCAAYLTNDSDLPSIPGLRILQLRDYLPA